MAHLDKHKKSIDFPQVYRLVGYKSSHLSVPLLESCQCQAYCSSSEDVTTQWLFLRALVIYMGSGANCLGSNPGSTTYSLCDLRQVT